MITLPKILSGLLLFLCITLFGELAAQPCTGAPAPGNTLSTTTTPCPGTSATLSLQNVSSLGTGITYQWHTTSGAIAGATNDTCNVVLTGSSETYWCEVTCTLSSLTTGSTPITLNANSFIFCYCLSNATAIQDEDIYNVTLDGNSTDPLYAYGNGCVNVAPGPGSMLKKYSSFMTLPPLANLIQGLSSNFAIVQDECDGPAYFSNRIGIWIDFNHNANFSDPGEQVFMEASAVIGPRTLTGSFVVPPAALPGNTMMRIVCREGGTPSPCGWYNYGETEDYLVNIIPAGTCTGTPNPGNTLSPSTTVCAGAATNLTLQNLTFNATYQWYNGSGAIAGATNTYYLTTLTSTDSFYCTVTCISSGLSANSSTLVLNVNSVSSGSSSVTACDTYLWNSTLLNSSGTYTATLTNAVGCDSVHTLNLTIYQSSTVTFTLNACDSVQYNGSTYTNSGVYTLAYTNSNGCDSITVLNVTINTGSDSICLHTDCDFYTFNGVLYSSSGIYTHTFTNAYGCDSIIHLDLTIHQSTDSVILANSCNAFTLNGLTYTMTGNYSQTLLNASGCDSTLVLQATIDTLTALLTTSGTGLSTPSIGTFQWLDCNTNTAIAGATSLNFTPTAGGSYAVIVTTATCIDTSICLNVWATQVQELLDAGGIHVSPNPSHGLFTFDLPEASEISILNCLGEEILKGNYNRGQQVIDVSKFPVGMYILKVKTGIVMHSIKLLKE